MIRKSIYQTIKDFFRKQPLLKRTFLFNSDLFSYAPKFYQTFDFTKEERDYIFSNFSSKNLNQNIVPINLFYNSNFLRNKSSLENPYLNDFKDYHEGKSCSISSLDKYFSLEYIKEKLKIYEDATKEIYGILKEKIKNLEGITLLEDPVKKKISIVFNRKN